MANIIVRLTVIASNNGVCFTLPVYKLQSEYFYPPPLTESLSLSDWLLKESFCISNFDEKAEPVSWVKKLSKLQLFISIYFYRLSLTGVLVVFMSMP